MWQMVLFSFDWAAERVSSLCLKTLSQVMFDRGKFPPILALTELLSQLSSNMWNSSDQKSSFYGNIIISIQSCISFIFVSQRWSNIMMKEEPCHRSVPFTHFCVNDNKWGCLKIGKENKGGAERWVAQKHKMLKSGTQNNTITQSSDPKTQNTKIDV